MNRRLIRLIIVTATVTLLITFLGTVIALAAPTPYRSFSHLPADELNSDIRARRVFTPDFGIASPLMLGMDGRVVLVEGHGSCAEGEMYEIWTHVTHHATGAIARGTSQGSCTTERFQWQAEAAAQGAQAFSPGPARVCALARSRAPENGPTTMQRHWCKEVQLVSETP